MSPSDLESRWAHTRGYSTTDLLRHRAGDTSDMPDAVVYPATHDEVLALLAGCCRRTTSQSCPYSGGTSVVGGLAPDRRFVTVDLRRLDQLVDARRDLANRDAAGRRPGSGGRSTPRRPRLHTRPLSTVLRGRVDRRLCGRAVERAVVGRVRTLRPDGGRADAGHAARDDRARPRADVRGRPGSAPARARVRGRVRDHHVGRRTDPAATGRAALRGLAVRELRRRSDRDPAAGAGRAVADRAAVVRRGRDGGEPGRSGCARWRVGRRTGDRRFRRAVQLRDRRGPDRGRWAEPRRGSG